MQEASEKCAGHIWDMHQTRTRHSMQAHNLAIKLLQDVRECHAHVCQTWDACEMSAGRV